MSDIPFPRVHTYGSRFFGGQVDRIDMGLHALGWNVNDEVRGFYSGRPSFYYANDENAGRNASFKKDNWEDIHEDTSKLIINILDIPEHNLATYDLAALASLLKRADAVTCISQFVQSQLIKYINQGSSVIYQPIKPVTRNPSSRGTRSRFLHVGRRADGNKRFGLAVAALQILGVIPSQVVCTGNDAGCGIQTGVVTDVQLNEEYNATDFVLATSAVEGLSLPVLEAMAAGVIPIVARDMTTRTELLPPALFPEYEDVHPTPTSVARFIARFMQDNNAMQEMKDRLHKHYLDYWQYKVSPKGVAEAIVRVYDTLK